MSDPDPTSLALALDAATALSGVPTRPEWREAALANLATVATAAQFVAAFPLDDEAEYAPVFQP